MTVLGLSQAEAFPAEVRERFAALERPDDIDWVGTPVWVTAHTTGLRAIAHARQEARRAGRAANPEQSPQAFNASWNADHLGVHAPDELADPNGLRAATFAGESALRALVQRSEPALHSAAWSVRHANRLLLASPEQRPSAAWSSTGDNRAGLHRYVDGALRWFTVSPPRADEKTRLGRLPEIPNALLVALPPAGGKGKLAGDWLADQGVGSGPGSPKVLWVTEQQSLVREFLDPNATLRKCLPPGTKTTAVWEDHKTPEDISGDAVGTTANSLETELATPENPDGLIKPKDYKFVVFDEGDIMLSKLRQRIMRSFPHAKILVLTATPTRSARKDLQRLMHHVRPVTPLEAVRREISTPVRILTYVAESPEHAEELAASLALHLFIGQGKKAVMYCQPGGGNAQAKRIARQIKANASAVLGDDFNANTTYAEMVGSIRPDSAEVIEHFDNNVEAGILTAHGMMRRGVNFKRLEGCLFVGPQGDITALAQEMGRPTRLDLNNPNKVAVFVQIKYPPQAGRTDYTAEMIYGLESVMTDITLGPGMDEELEAMRREQAAGAAASSSSTGASGGAAAPGAAGESTPEPQPDAGGAQWPAGGAAPAGGSAQRSDFSGSAETAAGGAPENGGSAQPAAPRPSWLADLPPELRRGLQPFGRPLAEVVLAPDDPDRRRFIRPPGYDTTIAQLMERFPGIRRTWFQDKLDAFVYTDPEAGKPSKGVPHSLIWSLTPDGPPPERYYRSDLVDLFLQKTDVPKVAAADSLSKEGLAARLGVPPSLIKVAARELGIKLNEKELPTLGRGRPSWRYNATQIGQITDWVEALPTADDTKVWYTELSRTYGQFASTFFARKRVTAKICLHPPDSGLNGLGPYVDIGDADAMKAEHERVTGLMATTRRVVDIARRMGVSRDTVVSSMNATELAEYEDPGMRFVEIGGASRKPGRHLSTANADALEARIRNQSLLLPYEVTRRHLASFMKVSESRVVQQLPDDWDANKKRLGEGGASLATYHIAGLRIVAEHYRQHGQGQRHEKDPDMLARLDAIDFSQLPAEGEEGTAEQQEYARYVQQHILHIPSGMLASVSQPEPGAAPEEAAQVRAPEPEVQPGVPADPEPEVEEAEEVSRPEPEPTPEPEPEAEAEAELELKPETSPVQDVAPDVEPAPDPEPPAPEVVPEVAPSPPGTSLDEIGAAARRTPGATRNMVRQLGLAAYLDGDTLPAEHVARVVAALRGGRKSPPAEAAPPTASAPAPAPAAPAATPPSSPVSARKDVSARAPEANDPDPNHWRDVSGVMLDLKCTPIALRHMIAANRRLNSMLRRRGADGPYEMHMEAVRLVTVAAKRIEPVLNGWMTNERLAKNVGVSPQELPKWLAVHEIHPAESQQRVARSSSQSVVYDVIYHERVWGAAIVAHEKEQKKKQR